MLLYNIRMVYRSRDKSSHFHQRVKQAIKFELSEMSFARRFDTQPVLNIGLDSGGGVG